MQRERKNAKPSIVPAPQNVLSSVEINQIYTLNHVTLITSLSRDITRKYLRWKGLDHYRIFIYLNYQTKFYSKRNNSVLKSSFFFFFFFQVGKRLEKFFLDSFRRFPNVQSLSEIRRSSPIVLVPVYLTTRSKQRWRL